MLPQVLFAGAIVPVPHMVLPGRVISYGMTDRWAFESLGRLLPFGTTGGDPALLRYAGALHGPAAVGWAVLAATATVLTGATVVVLRRRS